MEIVPEIGEDLIIPEGTKLSQFNIMFKHFHTGKRCIAMLCPHHREEVMHLKKEDCPKMQYVDLYLDKKLLVDNITLPAKFNGKEKEAIEFYFSDYPRYPYY